MSGLSDWHGAGALRSSIKMLEGQELTDDDVCSINACDVDRAVSLSPPDTLNVIAARNLLMQYSGVLSIGPMSIGMILVTRSEWLGR